MPDTTPDYRTRWIKEAQKFAAEVVAQGGEGTELLGFESLKEHMTEWEKVNRP